MWAHYASSHSGYVIEFDNTHPFFSENSNEPDVLWRLQKIVYTQERPKTVVSELDFVKILLTKSLSWEYEREWRVIKPLNDADRILPGNPLPIHLFDFPPQSIRSVILGKRMPKPTQLWFHEKIKLHNTHRHVKLLFAHLDEQQYRLNFESTVSN
jgi:hypothetical protein